MLAIDLIRTKQPCDQAVTWLEDKTPQEAWNTCPRGDWMLWFYAKMYPEDLKNLALAKGHCVNTVRHLMKDERSLKAVDTTIAFGEGRATIEELTAASDAAAYAAAYAASDASDASNAASDAAYAAASYAAVSDAAAYNYASVERIANQKQTADICRKYLYPELTTYIHDESVVKGKKTALLLCLILMVILIGSSYVN